MPPLERLAEGVSQGDGEASEQSRGPLASGAGGRPQAQRGGAPRYLLSSASCPYPHVQGGVVRGREFCSVAPPGYQAGSMPTASQTLR